MPSPTNRTAEPIEDQVSSRRGRASRIGGVAVIAVIAVQVTVPLVALFMPPPQRFGFQMYSGTGLVTATISHENGDETVLTDLRRFVGKFRGDQDWRPVLPEAICDQVPDAIRVTVEQSGTQRSVDCD